MEAAVQSYWQRTITFPACSALLDVIADSTTTTTDFNIAMAISFLVLFYCFLLSLCFSSVSHLNDCGR